MCGIEEECAVVTTKPTAVRLPNGATVRTPGFTASCSSGGTAYVKTLLTSRGNARSTNRGIQRKQWKKRYLPCTMSKKVGREASYRPVRQIKNGERSIKSSPFVDILLRLLFEQQHLLDLTEHDPIGGRGLETV